jgi:hypothetical protein
MCVCQQISLRTQIVAHICDRYRVCASKLFGLFELLALKQIVTNSETGMQYVIDQIHYSQLNISRHKFIMKLVTF